ncbi:hypothetical protein, partial [Alistipes senegalensis]|uniref:hypothetical protein n=1 Tax=Alistipes senegalensis TaxID=1288121 RepID=UPI001E5C24C5
NAQLRTLHIHPFRLPQGAVRGSLNPNDSALFIGNKSIFRNTGKKKTVRQELPLLYISGKIAMFVPSYLRLESHCNRLKTEPLPCRHLVPSKKCNSPIY